MMRWIVRSLLMAGVLATMAGCTQLVYVTESDIEHYQDLMPANLEHHPEAAEPCRYYQQEPVTVRKPESRVPWHLSLAEAIAIALENGTTGIQSVAQPGRISDDLINFQQLTGIHVAVDSIRVLSLNPAYDGNAIEQGIARFDPKWITNVGWRYNDQQVQGLSSFQNGQTAHFESGLAKLLATGGVAGITFSTDYTNLAQPPTGFPIQNPAYIPKLSFTFDQPLLQNFGVDINQMLTRPPFPGVGNNLTGFTNSFLNGSLGSQQSGILIARLRFDQSRADFERLVNHQLLNVESAYWNLYGSYINYYAAEQGMKMAHEVWRVTKNQAEAGQGVVMADANRAEGQFRLFQGDRIAALSQVLENERILRRLLGLKAEDGKQIIPIDAPTLAPYQPNWEAALQETVTLRPELVALREELHIRQMNLMIEKNFLLPDLRLTAGYDITALGSRLDGNGQIFDAATGQFRSNNALRNLSSNHFNNWNFGLTLNVPLGFRFEHARVRQERLRLAQTLMGLRNEEAKAVSYLTSTYRKVIDNYEQIKSRRAQRLGFTSKLKQLASLLINAPGDKKLINLLETTLQSQRDWVNAINQEYQAIVAYNNSLAAFQFAKGTIQQHNSVSISEGVLPECAQVRAVEHERERSKALLLRERARPIQHSPCGPAGGSGIPDLPEGAAPSIPALKAGANGLDETMKGITTNGATPPPAGPNLPSEFRPGQTELTLPPAAEREPTSQSATNAKPEILPLPK